MVSCIPQPKGKNCAINRDLYQKRVVLSWCDRKNIGVYLVYLRPFKKQNASRGWSISRPSEQVQAFWLYPTSDPSWDLHGHGFITEWQLSEQLEQVPRMKNWWDEPERSYFPHESYCNLGRKMDRIQRSNCTKSSHHLDLCATAPANFKPNFATHLLHNSGGSTPLEMANGNSNGFATNVDAPGTWPTTRVARVSPLGLSIDLDGSINAANEGEGAIETSNPSPNVSTSTMNKEQWRPQNLWNIEGRVVCCVTYSR